MQVGNHRAKRHDIAKNVTEIQRDRSDVMQKHFFKVIVSCPNEMLDQVTKVIPVRIKRILQDFALILQEYCIDWLLSKIGI